MAKKSQTEPEARQGQQAEEKSVQLQRGKKGQKGLQKGKGKGETPLAPPPPPPLTGPNASAPPWTSMPIPPNHAQSQGESAAEQRLSEVLGLLNKQDPDTLSTDLQAFVQKEGTKIVNTTAKQRHLVVNDLTKAERAMDAAINSRTNLLASWRSFITTSLNTWKEYTSQFQQQELKCQEEIQAAKEALKKARERAQEGFSSKVIKLEMEETVIVSDDEEAKNQAAKASTDRILGGLQNMTTSLQELSVMAEQEHLEAQRSAKRPRKDAQAEIEMQPEAPTEEVPDSAQPFGKPGQ